MEQNLETGISYQQKGLGEDILLLHGWGGSTQSFQTVFEYFSKKNYKVTNIDFLGFGQSKALRYPFTVTDYSDSIVKFLASINISKTNIIAHSFGGRVAIKIAATKPQLVNKLILVDSAGIKPRRKLRYYVNVLKYKFAKIMGLKSLSKYGSEDFKKLNGVMKGTFINVVNENLTKYLKDIIAKTLLVWGENDKDTPLRMAYKMNKLIKPSKLVIFRDAGHFSFIDKVHLFLKLTEKFLGDIYD